MSLVRRAAAGFSMITGALYSIFSRRYQKNGCGYGAYLSENISFVKEIFRNYRAVL